MQNEKLVYFFGAGKADGDASMKRQLGGKAWYSGTTWLYHFHGSLPSVL